MVIPGSIVLESKHNPTGLTWEEANAKVSRKWLTSGFDSLLPGQSFKVSERIRTPANVRASAYQWSKRTQIHLVVQKCEGGCRVVRPKKGGTPAHRIEG